MSAPVVLHPRAIDTPWTDLDGKRNRLVIPAAAMQQVDALPVPDAEELAQWDVVYLDGSTVDVLNLADRRKWRIRRGQCGFGSCACDAVAWPADYTGPIPDPEPFDAWAFHMEPEDWDELEAATGRPVGDLPWEELLAVAAEARGADEA